MLKRVQVLLDPEQHVRLRREARSRRTSVAALIREAVDRVYPRSQKERDHAYRKIVGANLPVDDWPKLERRLARNVSRDVAKGMR